MGLLSTIQAESGQLNDATLITDADFSPAGANNGVSVVAGPQNVDFANIAVPNGTTRIKYYVKRINSGQNGVFNLHNFALQNPYNAFQGLIQEDGLIIFEDIVQPSGHWNFDGNNFLFDKIEFHDDSNIYQPAPPTPTNPTGVIGQPFPGTATEAGTIEIFDANSVLVTSVNTEQTAPFAWTYTPFATGAFMATLGVQGKPVSEFSATWEIFPEIVPAPDFDIQYVSGSMLSTSSGLVKFKNGGTSVYPSGKVITFTPSFKKASDNSVLTRNVTPTIVPSNLGTFSTSGNNLVLTLSRDIAVNESFDIEFSVSQFLGLKTIVEFLAVVDETLSETNINDNTATATYIPDADLLISEVSKNASGFTIKVKNNLGKVIALGQQQRIKLPVLPSGVSEVVATTPKGTITGIDYVSGVTLTLDSDLATNEEYNITFSFTGTSSGYTVNPEITWISEVTDNVPSNNTLSITYTQSSGGGGGYYSSEPAPAIPSTTANAPTQKDSTSSVLTIILWVLGIFAFLIMVIFFLPKLLITLSSPKSDKEKENKK